MSDGCRPLGAEQPEERALARPTSVCIEEGREGVSDESHFRVR